MNKDKYSLPLREDERFGFENVREIVDILLGDGGCAWDRKQSIVSLKKFLIEECYEVIEAVNKKDYQGICEELGDVLYQVFFMAKLCQEAGEFTIEQVVDGICRKIISRHTHIFGSDGAQSPEEIEELWKKNKLAEKGDTSREEALRSIPAELPALLCAQKVLKKADEMKLHTPSFEESLKECEKLTSLADSCQSQADMEECGSILINMVNILRYFQINAEFSLTNAIETYINKFSNIKE